MHFEEVMIMNRLFFVALIALMMISGVAANAGTYTFKPSPPDLYDLPHGNYYTWGIKWDLPAAVVLGTEVITGATFRTVNSSVPLSVSLSLSATVTPMM